MARSGKKGANSARHSTQCSVCNHPQKQEIERLWRAGSSSRALGRVFNLPKDAVSRHAAYFGIERSLQEMLYRIVEAGMSAIDEKQPTPAHINEAIKSLAKLQGLWVDKTELMPPGWADRSDEEVAFFAAHGRFPQPDEIESVH